MNTRTCGERAIVFPPKGPHANWRAPAAPAGAQVSHIDTSVADSTPRSAQRTFVLVQRGRPHSP